MGVADLYEALRDASGLMLRTDEPLSDHLPLRVGGPVELWAEVSTENALERFTSTARATQTRWKLHWPFTDWLVRDGGVKGVVLRLGGDFERIDVSDESITLGAASLWSGLPSALEGGLWDAIRTWPGSVGALIQDGRNRQLSELVTGLRILRGGRFVDLQWTDGEPPPKLGDNSVLVSVEMRRAPAARTWLTPPPAPGTLFTDIENTVIAKELHRAGVLGTRLRNWRLSAIDPGTIIQLGSGSFSDLSMLIKGIKARVEKTRGVRLEPRIPILGSNQKPNHREATSALLKRETS